MSVGHILIGAPGSGKTTLAQCWLAHDSNLVWVSSDRIRKELYGNAAHQGDWHRIEEQALRQIEAALLAGKNVLYDATNALRPWRIDLLQKLAQLSTADGSLVPWLGWHLKTSLADCSKRNKKRDRQVPQSVIDRAVEHLKAFPPCVAEGFAIVETVQFKKTDSGQLEPDFEAIDRKINGLDRSLQGRKHRYKHMELHYYSNQLHFDRLLYLIALILEYPGLGALHTSNPSLLQTILQTDTLPSFSTELEEIAAVMARKRHKLYGDPVALQGDLQWLQENHFLNTIYVAEPLKIRPLESTQNQDALAGASVASYGDSDRFAILLSTLRFLVHQPIFQNDDAIPKTAQQNLLNCLQEDPSVPFIALDHLRRDIENIFKPYGFLENRPMRQGYVVGSSILQPTELFRLFQVLEPQAIKLEDPLVLDTYNTFQERLQLLKLDTNSAYRVRTILNHPIMAQNTISDNALAKPRNLVNLEMAIQNGVKIKLRKLKGYAKHPNDTEGYSEVWPLQLGYYNIGWYLGYQDCQTGKYAFDRIDRLEGLPLGEQERSASDRQQALKDIDKLQHLSYSLFLGNSVPDQQALLSKDPKEQAKVLRTLEIWCSDEIFSFISEGTQRFAQMAMSPPPERAILSSDRRKIFNLEPTLDKVFPHRIRAEVPYWVIESDYEFLAWVMRFGAKIKVQEPVELRDYIAQEAAALHQLYSSIS